MSTRDLTAGGLELPTGIVTFALTDVVGSSRLWEKDPERAKRAITAHRRLIDDLVARRGGARPQEQGEGDSTLSAFGRAQDACAFALDIQDALRTHPDTQGIAIRVAIHTGEAQLMDARNYLAAPINRCGRLRGLAHPGQILLSRTTWELVTGALSDGVETKDLGMHRLKDLTQPEHVFQLQRSGSAQQFPPLSSLDAFTNNLPVQLTSFVGRDKEVHELTDLISSNRLVTLSGSGGCGKTRLSLQVAADVVTQFSDGVWFVELTSVTDPTQVAAEVANALLLQPGLMQTRLETVKAFLKERTILIVLDNCEHLIEACAELSEILLMECPGVSLVATSREPLGVPGEVVWRVPSLSSPPEGPMDSTDSLLQFGAPRLFMDRAIQVRSDFTIDDSTATSVCEICRRLDGIPLAIELAAARSRLMAPQEILTALEDTFRLLRGRSRTQLARQTTLEASVQWSYSLLTEPEQVLLDRLAVFWGFTLEDVEAVCGFDPLDKRDILDLLESLIDKSLVQVEDTASTGRYRLLETIRQFAARELHSRKETDRLRVRHARFFLESLARERSRLEVGDDETIARFEIDFDNIRSAVEWAVGAKKPSLIAEASWSLALAATGTGRMADVKSWIEQALQGDVLDPPTRADSLLGLGLVLQHRLEIFDAAPVLEEALGIYRELNDQVGIARAAAVLGFCQLNLDRATAVGLLDAALESSRATSDQWTQMQARLYLGWNGMETDLVQGRAHLTEALRLGGRRAQWRHASSLALGFLAWVSNAQGYWQQGCELAEQALSRFGSRRGGLAFDIALTVRGDARLHLGRLDEARQDLEQASRSCEESQNVATYPYTLWVVAELELQSGNLEAARSAAEQAVALAIMPMPAVQAQVELARVLLASDDRQAAHACLDPAVPLAASHGLQWVLALAVCAKGHLTLGEGEISAAEGHFSDALRIFHEARSISGAVECFEALGEIAGCLANWADAARLISCAQALRDETGFLLPGKDPDIFDPLLERLKDNLGDDFDRIWAEGVALGFDDGVEYATGAAANANVRLQDG